MKVRPYERSTLWRSAFAKRRNDPDEADRQALAIAYHQLRDRAGDLVNQIHAALPQLTVHDLTHADTLWDVASEICGRDFKLNPLEGFVLGASFLLHDAGMALAAYPNGLKDLQESVQWRDAVASAWKKSGVDEPTDLQRDDPEITIRDEATFQVLRARHASQARDLSNALWTQPSTGRPLALVQNDDLLESYGRVIGDIAASHHWPLPEIARYFGDATPASAAWPREWEVDSLTLACILRCADACAIDETRAPSFLFAIRKPSGDSKRHWNFQNKIYPAKRRDDSLVFESKSPFRMAEAADWWLCFDSIEVADRELRSSDALLTDRKRSPFAVRRAVGAGDPDILAQSVKVVGWRPVNTLPKISDPQSIIERLGGKQLYGNDPVVPIRELIQNSVDAIRARRFLDTHFASNPRDKYPGKILLEFGKTPDSNEYWIAVEDDGIGMSERTITRALLDFGTSFWSSDAAAQLYPGLPSAKQFKPVGRFGIGFFSVFMYSDVVKVMSREFRSASNAWNALSFTHGVRGRANLSVEDSSAEAKTAGASTRIKIDVNEEFVLSLAESSRLFGAEDSLPLREQLITILKPLVCALDVTVFFSFMGEDRFALNNPLIYEKGLNAVCKMVERGVPLSDNQKQMLCEMRGGENEFYGFCGVSIEFSTSLVKSVGGLGNQERYGRIEPIVGIAEYDVTSANREPNRLSAPEKVINEWVKEQFTRLKKLPLGDWERERASYNLGSFSKDIRPIFFVRTSIGGLDLDGLISKLKERRLAIVPTDKRMGRTKIGNSQHYYPSLPTVANSPMRMEEIDFHEFAICPHQGQVTLYDDPESLPKAVVKPGIYTDVWSTIINTLSDSGLDFEIEMLNEYPIGTYVGLDSPRHGLKRGSEVKCDSICIRLKV